MSISFNIRDWNTDGQGPRFNVGAFPATMHGLYVQTYLDKVPGSTPQARRATLLTAMKKWAALGVRGWAPHGFTTTLLPVDASAYADMAAQAKLLCVTAFGLNEENPQGKGSRMAAVARVPGISAVIADAEGAWQAHTNMIDAQAAVAMGQELANDAPGVIVIYQPWPVPEAHRDFPEVAFDRSASARATQDYFNAYLRNYGVRRIRVMEPSFAENQIALERDILTPCGVGGIPHLVTLESYGYGDILYDYTSYVIRHETIFFWSEWQPDAAALHAFEARQLIDRTVGLYVNGVWSGQDAVLRFQTWYNAQASNAGRKLAADGVYGPKTDAALFGSALTRFARSFGRLFA